MGTIKQKVSLEGLRLRAYHGYYPEEQATGSDFILDIDAEMDVFGSSEDDLAHTVNYERLYQIAEKEMAVPRKLIETVAHEILDQIRHEFLAVKTIRVKISKLNPPLGADLRCSAVELCFKR